MRIAKRIFLLLLASYIIVEALVIYFQRDLIYLSQTTAPIDPPLGIAQAVSFPSEDGIRISGWWVTPQVTTNARALLYCHGNGATLAQLKHVAKLFYDYGLHALLFDYRGYGSSQKAKLNEESIAADSRAAYDWIKREQQFLDKQIVIWGHSLGGAVAARLATERTPAALITEGVFSSIYDMGRHRYPFLYLNKALLLDHFEAANYLSRRSMPLLMLHAERDTIIPLALGKKSFDMANEPKSWILLSEIDHNDFPSVEARYRAQILEFIESSVSKRP